MDSRGSELFSRSAAPEESTADLPVPVDAVSEPATKPRAKPDAKDRPTRIPRQPEPRGDARPPPGLRPRFRYPAPPLLKTRSGRKEPAERPDGGEVASPPSLEAVGTT